VDESEERPGILVHLEPEGKSVTLPKANTVLQLLNKLGRRPGTALVIREGGLLTPDVQLLPGDVITLRGVGSVG
jgi:sulfur carrier protein